MFRRRQNKKISLFPVAQVHCILNTKSARSCCCCCCFVLFCFVGVCGGVCLYLKIKVKKENKEAGKKKKKKQASYMYKMIFRPEHAEDIRYGYLINQMVESVPNFNMQNTSKKICPTYGIMCVFCLFVFSISSCSVDKQIGHCWFYPVA